MLQYSNYTLQHTKATGYGSNSDAPSIGVQATNANGGMVGLFFFPPVPENLNYFKTASLIPFNTHILFFFLIISYAMAIAGSLTPHPYYPQDLILNHYVANTNTVFHTLVYVSIGFFAVLALVCVLGYPRRHSALGPLGEKVAFFWFILCATLHLGFEGYYDIYHATLAGDNSPIAQVWKEYALSDSRYLTSDSFVRVVEAITTVGFLLFFFFCISRLYFVCSQ